MLDGACLTRLLFVLKTGIPREMGYGSGMTCWRRLGDWHSAIPPTALRGVDERVLSRSEVGRVRHP